MTVLEHHDQGSTFELSPQHVGKQTLQRSFAQLGIKRSGDGVIRDVELEQVAQQRCPDGMLTAEAGKDALDLRDLIRLRAAIKTKERMPGFPPCQIARVASKRLPLAKGNAMTGDSQSASGVSTVRSSVGISRVIS